jgi:hypothetical protein
LTAKADAAPGVARPALGAKGVFAAVLGNGFEFFDFTVYATYLGMIGQAFSRRTTFLSAISRRRPPSAWGSSRGRSEAR